MNNSDQNADIKERIIAHEKICNQIAKFAGLRNTSEEILQVKKSPLVRKYN